MGPPNPNQPTDDTPTMLADGSLRCKFPRNFVGVTRIDPLRLLTGTGMVSLQVKHGEVLLNGTGAVSFPWHENEQTDRYLNLQLPMKGAVTTVQPRFTWHGFQYVQITLDANKTDSSVGFDSSKKPAELCEAVLGLEVRNELEKTGELGFEEGHILNRLNQLVRYSQECNVAASQPTDCPTREKHGWLGDAQVTAEEAMLNFHMAAIYTEYLVELQDAQVTSGKRAGDVPGVCPVKGTVNTDMTDGSSNTKRANQQRQHSDRIAFASLNGGGLHTGPDGITDISW
jgi:alpha-L-rhamnosidase